MTTAIQWLLRLYHPASLALLLAGDWAITSLELALPGPGTVLAGLGGFIAALLLTARIEKRLNNANTLKAIAKGVVLGVAVAVPAPVVGTLIGAPLLVATVLDRREAKRIQTEPAAPPNDSAP